MDSEIKLMPYDLIEVMVKDTKVYARPIEWEKEIVDSEGRDSDGELVKAIKYETGCPHCGQLLMFKSNLKSVKCTECNVGDDELTIDEFPDVFVDPGSLVMALSISDLVDDEDEIVYEA